MVNTRTVVYLFSVATLVTALLVIAVHYLRRAGRSSRNDWENLLKRLIAVDRMFHC